MNLRRCSVSLLLLISIGEVVGIGVNTVVFLWNDFILIPPSMLFKIVYDKRRINMKKAIAPMAIAF